MITSLHEFIVFNLVFLFFCLGINFAAYAAKPSPTKQECDVALRADKVSDLSFGDFEGTNAGTVTVTPAGSRSVTGVVPLGGTITAAQFSVYSTIDNCDAHRVSIKLPKGANGPDLEGAGTPMSTATYTSTPSKRFNISATKNVATQVNVGATLTTNAAQASGPYTTLTPFTVTFSQ